MAIVDTGRIIQIAGDALRYALTALQLMRMGDAKAVVDKIITQEQRAETAFGRGAYASWSMFPDHPAAPALAALQRNLAGQSDDAAPFRGLRGC
jgi:hypothetical protein